MNPEALPTTALSDAVHLVRVEGIEPSLTESKSVVLPLHNTRINLAKQMGLELA